MAAIIERLQAAVQQCHASQNQEGSGSQDEATTVVEGEDEAVAEAAEEADGAEFEAAEANGTAGMQLQALL